MIAANTCRSLCLFAAGWALLLPAGLLAAEGAAAPPAMLKDFADAPGLGDFLGGGGGADEMTLSGSFKVHRDQRSGVLEIRAVLAPEWHVYAIDQQGGPGPTKISVPASGPVRVTGPFQPDKPPEVRTVEVFDVPLREHYGQVIWSAPIELSADADVEKVRVEAVFDGQICSDNVGCKPIFGKKIEIAFGGYLDAVPAAPAAPAVPAGPAVPASNPPATLDEYRADRAHVSLRGHVEPSTVAAGGKLKLVISAVPDADWHLYAYAPAGSPVGGQAHLDRGRRAGLVDAGRRGCFQRSHRQAGRGRSAGGSLPRGGRYLDRPTDRAARHAAGRVCLGRDRGLPNLYGYRLRSAAGGEIHGKSDGRRGRGRRAPPAGFHGRALRRGGSVGCGSSRKGLRRLPLRRQLRRRLAPMRQCPRQGPVLRRRAARTGRPHCRWSWSMPSWAAWF